MRIAFGIMLVLAAGLAIWVAIARFTSKSIDGIPCSLSEQTSYHVHARFTLIDDAKVTYPPGGIGIHYEHFCLYWVHTHDATGIIHIEASHRISPTLGNFFDIWGQPLSRRQIWHFRVPTGQQMRVFVDGKRYPANPRRIVLRYHTAVTVEIGPPLVPPPAPKFFGL